MSVRCLRLALRTCACLRMRSRSTSCDITQIQPMSTLHPVTSTNTTDVDRCRCQYEQLHSTTHVCYLSTLRRAFKCCYILLSSIILCLTEESIEVQCRQRYQCDELLFSVANKYPAIQGRAKPDNQTIAPNANAMLASTHQDRSVFSKLS
jgi:hypothetical protein